MPGRNRSGALDLGTFLEFQPDIEFSAIPYKFFDKLDRAMVIFSLKTRENPLFMIENQNKITHP